MENFSENSESLLLSTIIPNNGEIESIWSKAGQIRSVPFITPDGHLSLHSSFLWKLSLVIHDLNPRMGDLHTICKLIVSNNSARLETHFSKAKTADFQYFQYFLSYVGQLRGTSEEELLLFSSFFFFILHYLIVFLCELTGPVSRCKPLILRTNIANNFSFNVSNFHLG